MMIHLFIIVVILDINYGYNVDLDSAIFHRGPRESMFGFSVATHTDRGESWALVGAPEANTEQPNVYRGGAVYRCSIDEPDKCVQIPFDRTGNNFEGQQQIDTKSNQWFGATVRSSGANGVVLACAPRYVWFSNNYKRREPVGTCFVSRNNFAEFSEYAPCRTSRGVPDNSVESSWGYHRQGSCQAGLGAALSPSGDRLFIGAVGSWYWQGQLFGQSLESRPDVVGTREGPPADDDSYLGYSVAVGDFNGDGNIDSAVGMPRGANLTGKVVLFTSNLTNLHNITGQQLGAYFGYDLTSTDVNGDGLDDIIIGAPLYTDYTNTEGKYETGRVYVMYQNERHKFRRWTILNGEVSRARFGMAISSLGDINQDGFKDFAVGSPYDGPNGKGAVYIFHGSDAEIRSKPAQVIYAEDVNDQMSTFGFSISGALDLDNNQYPDLLVGAYETNNAVFFRSRPVIHLDANLTFETPSKQIDLENKLVCKLLDNTPVPCTPLNLCVEYTGIGVDLKADIEVQFILDTKLPKTPRLFFLSDQGRNSLNKTYSLQKNSLFCISHNVYVKPGIRDKLTPLEAEARFFTTNGAVTTSVGGAIPSRRKRRALTPVLSQSPPPVRSDTIHIQKNCGPDNICIPNLRLAVKSNVDSYIMGSGQKLDMDVSVYNAGEDSFETMLTLRIPKGVSYVSIDRTVSENVKDLGILCSPPGQDNTLKCDIGNPLPAGRTANFKIVLQPLAGPSRAAAAAIEAATGEKPKSSLTFVLEANSTNPENEEDLDDNVRYLSVPIKVETELIIRGLSQPDTVYYNKSLYEKTPKVHESEIGPEVMHIYEIINKGPSDISQAEVHILWPSMNLAGDHLLYLVDFPEITGPAECSKIEVNPLRLQLDDKRAAAVESASPLDGKLYSQEERLKSKIHTATQHSSHGTARHATHSVTKHTSQPNKSKLGKQFDEYTTSKTTYIDPTGKKTVLEVVEDDDDDSPITVILPDETTLNKNKEKDTTFQNYGWVTTVDSGGNSGSNSVIHEGSKVINKHQSSSELEKMQSELEKERWQEENRLKAEEKRLKIERLRIEEEARRIKGLNIPERKQIEQQLRFEEEQRRVMEVERAKQQAIAREREDRLRLDRVQQEKEIAKLREREDLLRLEEERLRLQNKLREEEELKLEAERIRLEEARLLYEERLRQIRIELDKRQSQRILDERKRQEEERLRLKEANERYQSSAQRGSPGQGETEEERRNRWRLEYARRTGNLDETEEERQARWQLEQDRLAEEDGLRLTHYQTLQTSGNEDFSDLDSDGWKTVHRSTQHNDLGNGTRTLTKTETKRRVTTTRRKLKDGVVVEESSSVWDNPEPTSKARRRRASDAELEEELQCGPTQCQRMVCKIGPLAKGEEVLVRLRSRVWVQTLEQMGHEDVMISSKLVSRVTELPYGVDPDYLPLKSEKVTTRMESEDRLKDDGIPWWWILIAILIGILLLSLIVFILWKLGFFKRKRPTEGQEKQPLSNPSRNGFHPGDEAL
ncbi:integrin alpha-PS2-like isoform X3 [Artemia franciscana]|uniref:integrin alpha-PS2-like isoform X3 n=1 Tax=Artemia franciscana TaxID=6661 RepID=UPI0032DAA2C9